MGVIIKRPGVVIHWMGKEYEKEFVKEVLVRIRAACELVKSHLMRSVGQSSRTGASRPGQYPHAASGRFRASIFVVMSEEEVTGTIDSKVDHAVWLEFGHRGGTIIKPKRAKALRWVGANGRPVFARQVKQGAMAPRAPFKKAWYEMQGRVRALMSAPLKVR